MAADGFRPAPARSGARLAHARAGIAAVLIVFVEKIGDGAQIPFGKPDPRVHVKPVPEVR